MGHGDPRLLAKCPGCGRENVPHGSRGRCATCASRERRADPRTIEWLDPDTGLQVYGTRKDRENALRAAHRRSTPGTYKPRPPAIPVARPSAIVFCWICGNDMLDPDSTGMCGFCKIELHPADKLKVTVLPGQDGPWVEYFSLLDNEELSALIKQAQLERGRRLAAYVESSVLPQMTDIYRRDGHGNLLGEPDHHRRCRVCGALIANCKGDHGAVA